MMKNRQDYLGDVWYDVWRAGGDPDRVDPDCVEDSRWDGLWPEEAAEAELRRQRPESVPEEFAFLDPPHYEEEWERIARDHDEYMNRLFWARNTKWPPHHPMEDVAGGD
jgi:hypothetical protein